MKKMLLTIIVCALSILQAWVHIYADKPILNAVEIGNRIYAFGYNSDSTERHSGRWVNQAVFILSENGDYVTENPISDFIGVVQNIILADDNTFYCSAIAATRESYPDSYYAAVMIIDTLGNIVRSQSLSFDNTLRSAAIQLDRRNDSFWVNITDYYTKNAIYVLDESLRVLTQHRLRFGTPLIFVRFALCSDLSLIGNANAYSTGTLIFQTDGADSITHSSFYPSNFTTDSITTDSSFQYYDIKRSNSGSFWISGIGFSPAVSPFMSAFCCKLGTGCTFIDKFYLETETHVRPGAVQFGIKDNNELHFIVLTENAEVNFYSIDTLGNLLWENSLSITPYACTNLSLSKSYTCSNGDYLVCGTFTAAETQYGFLMRLDSLGNDAPVETNVSDNRLPIKMLDFIAYPNPFNSTLVINAFPHAKIEVFDIKGHKVFAAQVKNSGTVSWLPDTKLASGIYFAQVSFEKQVAHKKIVLIR